MFYFVQSDLWECDHNGITECMYRGYCYNLKSLEKDQRTTLVLSNTRELDRVPKTK